MWETLPWLLVCDLGYPHLLGSFFSVGEERSCTGVCPPPSWTRCVTPSVSAREPGCADMLPTRPPAEPPAEPQQSPPQSPQPALVRLCPSGCSRSEPGRRWVLLVCTSTPPPYCVCPQGSPCCVIPGVVSACQALSECGLGLQG